MTATPIRLMIVDDQPVVLMGLRALIDGEEDMSLVAEAEDGKTALALYAKTQPDVVVLDLRLADETGVDVVTRLLRQSPGARVIMYSHFAREDEIHAALQNGAVSYIPKGAPSAELLHAIRMAHAGRTYISPEIKRQLADRIDHNELSPRERDVLQLMFEGRSDKEIAARLTISLNTVRIHVNHVMDKLGAERRGEAVANALKKGIIRVD